MCIPVYIVHVYTCLFLVTQTGGGTKFKPYTYTIQAELSVKKYYRNKLNVTNCITIAYIIYNILFIYMLYNNGPHRLNFNGGAVGRSGGPPPSGNSDVGRALYKNTV